MKAQHIPQRRNQARTVSVCIAAMVAGCVHLIAGTFTCLAQSTAITSSGLGTTVTQNGTTYAISGGTRPGNGPNLFHSFSEFSVGTLNTARFQTTSLAQDVTVGNILARVTENNPSRIFGTIDSATYYPGANFYLMNPAGIVFGPTATLNVAGSVTFTTANYIRFFDEVNSAYFYADAANDAVTSPGRNSILSSVPLVDFGFVTPAAVGLLTPTPASISVQGSTLSVQPGQSLSLIGGSTTIEAGVLEDSTVQRASLSAPSGQINLASAGSTGEFLLAGLKSVPNIDGESFVSSASLQLAPGSSIDVSGARTVSIQGGRFVLSINDAVLNTTDNTAPSDTVALAAGSSILTENAGADADTADVQITTGTLSLDQASVLSITTGDGRGGNLSANAATFSVTNGGLYRTASGFQDPDTGDFIGGSGRAGDIGITAGESILISGLSGFSPSSVETFAYVGGDGGTLTLTAPSITVEDAGLVQSVTVGTGAGGNIFLTAPNGAVTVRGFQDLSIPGLPTFRFASAIKTDAQSIGNGGHLTLSSGSTTVENQGVIQTITFGQGNAGDITSTSQTTTLSGGGFMDSTGAGEGATGKMSVSATGTLSIVGTPGLDELNQTRISNTQQGEAANGGLTVHARGCAAE